MKTPDHSCLLCLEKRDCFHVEEMTKLLSSPSTNQISGKTKPGFWSNQLASSRVNGTKFKCTDGQTDKEDEKL